ncbi:MAG: CHAD domain-containing protein [Planctomycetota bacterium]
MPLPPDLPLRTPEEASRRIALEFLAEAHEASLRLDDDRDEEALHDFRVGIRRLRSTVRAWRERLRWTVTKKQRRALKALQAATGGGRDAEVAIQWLETQRRDINPMHRRGLQWLIERLERRHREAMAHAREDVRRAFLAIEDDLRASLEVIKVEIHLVDGTRGETFAAVLARKAREHASELVLHLARVAAPEDREEAHQARIVGKRLRYLVEPLRPWVPRAEEIVKRTKKLQDVLGDLNDAHVLASELGEALEAAAVEHVRRLHELVERGDVARVKRESRRPDRSGLREVARRTQVRAGELFDRLEAEWLEGGGGELLALVEAFAADLESLARPPVEIERKYLLRELPALPPEAESQLIDQGWLPGAIIRERIRRVTGSEGIRYLRTIKLGAGVERAEFEEEAGAAVFEGLWALTEGCRVRKRRHRVREGDYVWETDEFLDRELTLAEVELTSADEEPAFPEWLAPYVAREVTGEPKFVNLKLAR